MTQEKIKPTIVELRIDPNDPPRSPQTITYPGLVVATKMAQVVVIFEYEPILRIVREKGFGVLEGHRYRMYHTLGDRIWFYELESGEQTGTPTHTLTISNDTVILAEIEANDPVAGLRQMRFRFGESKPGNGNPI